MSHAGCVKREAKLNAKITELESALDLSVGKSYVDILRENKQKDALLNNAQLELVGYKKGQEALSALVDAKDTEIATLKDELEGIYYDAYVQVGDRENNGQPGDYQQFYLNTATTLNGVNQETPQMKAVREMRTRIAELERDFYTSQGVVNQKVARIAELEAENAGLKMNPKNARITELEAENAALQEKLARYQPRSPTQEEFQAALNCEEDDTA
jgi:hypothetical protein